MRGCSIVLSVFLFLALVEPAAAVELRWASGTTDLRAIGATRCTLQVSCTAAEESLPTELRLLFAGESESTEPVNVIADQPRSGVAAACAFPPLGTEDQISRVQVTEFCGPAGEPRARTMRFLIDVPSGLQARFKVIPITCLGGPCPSAIGENLEVSLNGGTSRPYPPFLLRAVGRQTGPVLTVSMDGIGLSRAETVRLVAAGTDASIPLQIVSKSDDLLIAELTPASFSGGRVEIGDDAGSVAAIAVQLASSDPPEFAGDYFLVRFRPGEVRRPVGRDAGAVSEFSFARSDLRDRLEAAGVSGLEPVFSWFRPTHVRSVNLIGEPVELEDLSDFYFARTAVGADVTAAVATLRDVGGVHWVGADYGGRAAQVVPNDPSFNSQWGLRNTGQTLCQQTASPGVDMFATNAWDRTTGSPSVRVAVLDTGIDTTHMELSGHVRAGPAFVSPPVSTAYDDDLSGRHGTAMAGIAAATGNNSNAIAGVAWQVTPWAVKVLRGSDTFTRASWVSQGISWATANGMPIICMGLGLPEAMCPGGPAPIPQDSAQIMNVAALNALYTGIASIASMGNCDGQVKHWPAAFDKRVYGVGAEYFDGFRWEDCRITSLPCGVCLPNQTTCAGSSIGPWIDAVAPGGRLIVTLAGGPNSVNDISPTCGPDNGFVGHAFGGTSASAGFATGIAALLRSQEPSLLGEDITNLLNITATHPLELGLRNIFVGYGRLNAAGATSRLSSPYRLFHHVIGHGATGQSAVGNLTDVDSIRVTQRFSNVPGLWGNVSYTAWRHRLYGVARFNDGFTLPPYLWIRSSGTWGWRDTTKAAAMDTVIDYNDDVRTGRLIGEIVPPGWSGGVQTDTFETIVYRVINPSNLNEGRWFPCPPESARVAFSTNGPFSAVGVEDRFLERDRLEVRAWPNPTQRAVFVSFDLPQSGMLQLSVLDIGGRRMRSLIRGEVSAGRQQLKWDGRTEVGVRCPPGVYFLQASFNGLTVTRRFLLLGGE